MIVGMLGLLAALALPFAPVWVASSTLTWPAPDRATTATTASSTAMIVPYRPASLTAVVPCAALRAAVDQNAPTVLDTGDGGLLVTADAGGASVRIGGHEVAIPVPPGDCRTVIRSTPGGMAVDTADGRTVTLDGTPVPKVFGFRTALGGADAAGLTVTLSTIDRFTTTPSPLKWALIGVALLAAAGSLILLPGSPWPRPRWRPRRAWWVDAGMVAVLAGWAVVGPLAVDDGWATMIARNVAGTGNPGNYYRWWNAAEVPFAFSQELLSGLTTISVAPLWLRVPSTLLAIATWFVLSRGVLGAALPVRSATVRVRLLAALCLLATWLPFDLGTRPESFVALGVTVVLALAMRARSPRDVGLLILAAALVVPISPNGALVLAPVVVFAPTLRAALRSGSPVAAYVPALASIAAVALVVIFGDQTWDALITATDWHTFFGPALPWYDEPDRYAYLLGSDQQGSYAKRAAVLLAIATVPVVLLLRWRRPGFVARAATRLAAVTVLTLALFAVAPSKWSYHLGAAAGPFAALLVAAVVLIARRTPDRRAVVAAVLGSALLGWAAAVSFAGPNAWWIPAVYDVPWAAEGPAPLGISLIWPVIVAAMLIVLATRRPTAAPAALVVVALGTSVAVMLGSFVAAPLRRPEGSLAVANLGRVTGERVCGLADDVDVLPDGPVLPAATDADRLDGFVRGAGYPPDAAPPDPPGVGTSEFLWGSWSDPDTGRASMTSRWFAVPALAVDGGLAVSVAGRTDDGNRLLFEFGRADGAGVTPLGERSPADRPASDEDPTEPLWRSIGVDAAEVPAGADRVRIRAEDGRTDDFGWLAVTGPRLRSVVPLTRFLETRGPVLVSWPQAFLFPCVRDVPTITAGVVRTPRAVIESPRPYSIDDRTTDAGGSFAGLLAFDELHEMPTRLRGRPDVDWGALRLPPDTATVDDYSQVVTRTLVPGIHGVPVVRPER
ncbi:arabinosyltransferase domain-containing protein [Mycolicibacterium sediminis]